MRVISGSARGRRLSGPGSEKGSKSSIRPTSDRVRESIFNILGPRSVVNNVLDLFAGTGALGIEALSRGSNSCTFVDRDRKAIGLISKNIDDCGFSDRSSIYQRDIFRGLGFLGKFKPAVGYDLVFCDPPYHMGSTVKLLEELQGNDLIAGMGLLVVEDGSGVEFPQEFGGVSLIDTRRYGDTAVGIFQNKNKDQK